MAQLYIDILKEKFGDAIAGTHSFAGDETAIVKREIWVPAWEFLKREHSFDMMLDLCGVDYPGKEDRFEVVVHARRMKDGARLRLKTCLPGGDPTLSTLANLFPAANWFEREAFDLFGIKFSGHPNLKRLLTHPSFVGHPLRKDYQKEKRCPIPVPDTLMDEMLSPEGISGSRVPSPESRGASSESRMYLNLGPSHPAMHGCFRVLVELDGEHIRKAVPEIGYLHRCFEKEAESHAWHTVIPYADRLNYCSPMMNSTGYCMAVEKLIGLEIPERAAWIRMLVCEVSRIWDHLVANAANLVDVGALTNFWYLFNAREKFTDWIEALTGARLTSNYPRIGGVSRDLPSNTKPQLRECLRALSVAIRDVEGLTKKNRILMDRTRGIGAISRADAIGYGFTGPCLRACGCEYDVRREHPYYFYDDLDWDIPVGSEGDTYDRIFVRFEEMKQSARIIEQILEKIPPGPIMADRRDLSLPPPHEVYGSIEGMIQHFKLVTDGIDVPAGEVYSYTEAANGELGFYAVSRGGAKPWRLKVRPPCFAIYQAYPKLIENRMVADAVAIIGSLNIIAGELDR